MTELTLEYYQAFNRRIRSLLQMGCLFRHPNLSPLAYGMIVIMTIGVNIYLYYAGIKHCIAYLRNFDQLCRGIAFLCSTGTAFVKVMYFWMNYNGLIELDETIKLMFDTELKEESRRSQLLNFVPLFQRVTTVYSIIIAGTCLSYHIIVMWVIPYQFIYHIKPKKCPIPGALIFPIKMQECGLLYMLHYSFTISNSLLLYFVNMNAEISFGYYAIQIAGIFRTMRNQLEKPEPNESRILLLRSCVKKHKKLLHCRDIMEDIYGPVIVCVILLNSFLICSLIYQAFQKKMTYLMTTMLAFYLAAKLMQTAVYTWCATVVVTESEKFSEGVYFSDWTDRSIAMKSDIVITMMQKPFFIKCMGLFIVSMDLFPKVINTALSYYFLLKTLD